MQNNLWNQNDASNMRFLYYAEMYIISIMQLAEKQERWILITTITHLVLTTEQLNKYC